MPKNARFLLGTSGWSYDDWRGVFYPEDLAKKYWLNYYANRFPMIELNATFYRFFKKENYIKWRENVPKGFQFIVKVPRLVTHYKFLDECDDIIHSFCDLVATLEEKFGLFLLQLPPNMPYDPDRLKKAVLAFDNPKKVIVEFRHQRWVTEEVKKLLTDIGCIYCAADSPKMKLLNWVTSKIAYIRLHGRKQWYDYNYSRNQLADIAKFAKSLKIKGATTIYIAFNNDYYGYAIKNAMSMKKLLHIT